jgi:hypothetical protein
LVFATSGTGFPSVFSIDVMVFPHAVKTTLVRLSAIDLRRAFTGDVSSLSMCNPGP